MAKTKLSWIIDARPGNMFFKTPPSVALCSSDTFSRIEIERDDFWPPSTSGRSASFDENSCSPKSMVLPTTVHCWRSGHGGHGLGE